MKKVSLVLVISLSVVFAGSSLPNLYGIKSAKVDYKISGSGNMMGMGTIKVSGKKRVIFKDYGRKFLEEKATVRAQNIMGQSDVQKEHTLTYKNGAVMYRADFKQKRIDRMVNQMASLAYAYKGDKDINKEIEKNLKALGAKKLGKDKVLGLECDVWKILTTKQCIYKGLTLKSESNVMGVKEVEVATKIEFDKVDDSSFKLPNFPIYSGSMEAMMSGVAPKKIDKSKLEELDRADNAKIAKMGEGAKEMGSIADAGLESAKKAGYDPNSKKEMTQEQQAAMQEAMMNAMNKGGVLEEMRRNMLQGANESALNGLKSCYEGANNLKDANSCVDKFSPQFGGEMERFSSWSAKDKKEAINEIVKYKKAIPCIKSAKTMQVLTGCMER